MTLGMLPVLIFELLILDFKQMCLPPVITLYTSPLKVFCLCDAWIFAIYV